MSAEASTSACNFKCLYTGCRESFSTGDQRQNHMLSSHPYVEVDPNVLFRDGRVYPMEVHGEEWICPCLEFASSSIEAVKEHALQHDKPKNTEYYKKPATPFVHFIQPESGGHFSNDSESDSESDSSSVMEIDGGRKPEADFRSLADGSANTGQGTMESFDTVLGAVGNSSNNHNNKRLTRATAPKGRHAHKVRSTKGMMREQDLGSYRLFRTGEIVWAKLHQSMGTAQRPHITHWPCIIQSAEFRILAPEYQQQYYYTLLPLALNEGQRLRYPASRVFPYCSFAPSDTLREFLCISAKPHKNTGSPPKISELNPATSAGYYYSIAVHIAAYASNYISLEAPYNVKRARPSRKRANDADGDAMDEEREQAIITDSEGEPSEESLASYTGCWLGNERIWKGDYVRLKHMNKAPFTRTHADNGVSSAFTHYYLRILRFYVIASAQGNLAMVCGTPHALRRIRLPDMDHQGDGESDERGPHLSPGQAAQSLSLNPEGYLAASQVLDYPLSKEYLPVPPDKHEFYALAETETVMSGRLSDIAGRWYPNGGNGMWNVEQCASCEATLVYPDRKRLLAIAASKALCQAQKPK